jgi:hypothetical protein
MPLAEQRAMEEGIVAMLQALDAAAMQSMDPPALDHIPVSQVVHTGRPRCPRIEIDPTFLAFALDMQGPSGVAPVVQCAPRTVQRRAIEQGLVTPGPPVYVKHHNEETSETVCAYTLSTPSVSTLTDNKLDNIIHQVLAIFPTFGRHMIDGYLCNLGHHVPWEHIQNSYCHVNGAPPTFNNHPIQCHVYLAAGPNSLSHHDRQHSELVSGSTILNDGLLIHADIFRFKMVEDCNPHICWWIFTLCNRYSSGQQQLCRDRIASLC